MNHVRCFYSPLPPPCTYTTCCSWQTQVTVNGDVIGNFGSQPGSTFTALGIEATGVSSVEFRAQNIRRAEFIEISEVSNIQLPFHARPPISWFSRLAASYLESWPSYVHYFLLWLCPMVYVCGVASSLESLRRLSAAHAPTWHVRATDINSLVTCASTRFETSSLVYYLVATIVLYRRTQRTLRPSKVPQNRRWRDIKSYVVYRWCGSGD